MKSKPSKDMRKVNIISALGIAVIMMGCENPMTFRTKVNEDGSLEKTIIFEKAEAKTEFSNVFGISEKNSWIARVNKPYDSARVKSNKDNFKIQFSKHFDSDQQMNMELDKRMDTLFQIHAKFEKKFRWFYTYIRYSETIRPINRFKMVNPKDFFTTEDSLFIQRLPAEGKTISKADSVSLLLLNEKVADHFANMGLFREIYHTLEEVIKRNLADKKWLDTLQKNEEVIYKLIEKENGISDFVTKVTDDLKIPLPKLKATKNFNELSKELNARINFMSFARDGKYNNEFEMPWTVVASNADSINGNKLYWQPVVQKFIYMDYEMFAESRRLNLWAVVVSLAIIGLTVFVLRKKTT